MFFENNRCSLLTSGLFCCIFASNLCHASAKRVSISRLCHLSKNESSGKPSGEAHQSGSNDGAKGFGEEIVLFYDDRECGCGGGGAKTGDGVTERCVRGRHFQASPPNTPCNPIGLRSRTLSHPKLHRNHISATHGFPHIQPRFPFRHLLDNP